MSIDLLLSSETGSSLTDEQMDNNLLTIEQALNNDFALIQETQYNLDSTQNDLAALRHTVDLIVPLDPLGNTFYSQLVLRVQQQRALTNEEVDSNFVYLDSKSNRLRVDVDTINNVTIPNVQSDYNAKLATKQDLNSKLTSLSNINTLGILCTQQDQVFTRKIISSPYLVLANQDGVNGDIILDIAPTVVTIDGQQVLTRKTIDGTTNTIKNVSLVTGVKDNLPVNYGGTNASTPEQARTNLNTLVKPSGSGIVVKTGSDQSVTRSLNVSGVGLSIQNPDATGGDIVISSSATASNTPNTVVARNSSGGFNAGMINANVTGNLTGNASTVTNGVYTNQFYNNPSWMSGLAGNKVTNIPNSSLVNSGVTLNNTFVGLGSSYDFDTGTTENLPSRIVKRDTNGNFSAGVITASINGSATTALSCITSLRSDTLSTPRAINGVLFDGSKDIMIQDGTKLPLTGGSMVGNINLPNDPLSALHAVTKRYTDNNDIEITFGTSVLYSIPIIGDKDVDIFPPPGRTMNDFKGFLPALGSSHYAKPTYISRIMFVIDVSLSMYHRHFWNNTWHDTVYKAAGKAAQALINHYVSLGEATICIIRTANEKAKDYCWFDSYNDAYLALEDIMSSEWEQHQNYHRGSVINAFDNKPFADDASHIACHYFSDGMENYGNFEAFGGAIETWRNYCNQKKIMAYSACMHELGKIENITKMAWDGITKASIRAFRALMEVDIPRIYHPGIYNNASIEYVIMSDRIRVSLTNGIGVDAAPVNWIAFWGKPPA